MREHGKKIMEIGNTKDVEVDLEQIVDKVVGGLDVAHAREKVRLQPDDTRLERRGDGARAREDVCHTAREMESKLKVDVAHK